MQSQDTDVVREGLKEFNAPLFGNKKSISFAIYLRDEEEKIVGGILAWVRPGIQLLCIDVIWVAEHLRGQGFGRKLMEAAEKEGLKNGCNHAQMETLKAEGFYKKLGYARIGCVEKFYGDHDAIYLRKYLK